MPQWTLFWSLLGFHIQGFCLQKVSWHKAKAAFALGTSVFWPSGPFAKPSAKSTISSSSSPKSSLVFHFKNCETHRRCRILQAGTWHFLFHNESPSSPSPPKGLLSLTLKFCHLHIQKSARVPKGNVLVLPNVDVNNFLTRLWRFVTVSVSKCWHIIRVKNN